MNVSSIVVKTAPQHVQPVMDNLRLSGLCEIHFHDESGQIVVTIEGKDISEEMGKLKLIQAMPQVHSAELAYAYSETELAKAREHIDGTKDAVPGALKE